MKYRFIRKYQACFSVSTLCRVLKVSSSGYYDWCRRPNSNRTKANEHLLREIKEMHRGYYQTYGYRRIYHHLRAENVVCSQNRIQRVMQRNGMKARRSKAYKVTTQSKHQHPIAPNLLERNFEADRPNQIWVSDITYIQTNQGWLYLATILDLFSRKIVGWAMESTMESILVERALTMAISQRKPQRKGTLIHHSDRGVQYASNRFQTLLKQHKITCSMSRKGNCWDNAVAESFFKTLKTELAYLTNFQNRDLARQSIFHYIEGFYNQKRLHSSLGYKSPEQFERAA